MEAQIPSMFAEAVLRSPRRKQKPPVSPRPRPRNARRRDSTDLRCSAHTQLTAAPTLCSSTARSPSPARRKATGEIPKHSRRNSVEIRPKRERSNLEGAVLLLPPQEVISPLSSGRRKRPGRRRERSKSEVAEVISERVETPTLQAEVPPIRAEVQTETPPIQTSSPVLRTEAPTLKATIDAPTDINSSEISSPRRRPAWAVRESFKRRSSSGSNLWSCEQYLLE